MRYQRRVNLLLAQYSVFGWQLRLSKDYSNVNLPRRNAVVVTIIGLALLVCSWIDETLHLPGEANGFLESPDIFGFLLASILLPFLARKSLMNFFSITTTQAASLSPEKFGADLTHYRHSIYRSVCRESQIAKVGYRLLMSIGFIFFAWNSFQNQIPMDLFGFAGWDTISHPFGYWGTRVYKLYLWLFLMPAVVHVELIFVWTIRSLLVRAAQKTALNLDPYHPDGCGGVLIFVDSVLNPLVPIVLTASLLTVATIVVHGRFDITTIGGLLCTCLLFLILYIIPATALRNAIEAEKRRKLQEIGNLQNRLYSTVLEHDKPTPAIRESLDLISSLGSICAQIKEIPNWPQLKFVVKLVSLAGSPGLVGITVKMATNLFTKFVGAP